MSGRTPNFLRALVALALPFLLSACGFSGPKPGSIIGTVYDAETSAALSGVNLTTDPSTESLTSLRGQDQGAPTGWYTFANIPAQEYTIKAAKPGYYDKQVAVNLPPGATITADIHMLADPTLESMHEYLMLYYPFTGDTRDLSGNENHGSSAKPLLSVYDRLGRPNSAYGFDGNQDYIVSTRPISVGPEFTVLLWVYRERDGAGGTFLLEDHKDKCSRGYGLALEGNGDLNILAASCPDEIIPTNVTIGGGCWHLVALVVRNTYLYLYIDGFQAGPPIPAVPVSNFQLALGAIHPTSEAIQASTFKGQIDDVRVYNGALPPNAIRALYGAYDCSP